MKNCLRIGCSSAFWGDSIQAARQLIQKGEIDFLVNDYLAEVTMGILAKRRNSKAQDLGGAGAGGYIAEFVTFLWKPLMKDILDRGIRLVTNAGGLDPVALKRAIEQACEEAGVNVPVVAAIEGDDILPKLNQLKSGGMLKPFQPIPGVEDWEMLPEDRKLESLNAYIGAEPIFRALNEGAQIVVTGRCVDSALVLGPLMHHFKWALNDYDRLAAGSLAGHIIECGCQATGGNFTDWRQSAFSTNGGWSNMGYPIVECYANGDFMVTKPPKTGGIVTVGTVSEQMVYEIGDPASYILPDVIVDLRQVELIQKTPNQEVLVRGVYGRAPTPFLKVSGIYMDGYKVTGELLIGGPEAKLKAESVGKAILERVQHTLKKFGLPDFKGTNIEPLGSECTYGPHSKATHSREVVLRLTVHHEDARALKLFLLEIAPSATCMAPGIIGVTSGRPRPQGNMVHVSCLVEKQAVLPRIVIGANPEPQPCPFQALQSLKSRTHPMDIRTPPAFSHFEPPSVEVPLMGLCYARSGDKGDSANIGVIARQSRYYDFLKQTLTEERVKRYMGHLLHEQSQVRRYELPGSHSMNFLISRCLGGGGLSSLQVDRQGKTYAGMLLTMPIKVPRSWLPDIHSVLQVKSHL